MKAEILLLIAVTPFVFRLLNGSALLTARYAITERFLYRISGSELENWLNKNPGVHVGLSDEGRGLVLKCLYHVEFMIEARERLGMRPLEIFDATEELRYLLTLLNDFPTLPPEAFEPADTAPRDFI